MKIDDQSFSLGLIASSCLSGVSDAKTAGHEEVPDEHAGQDGHPGTAGAGAAPGLRASRRPSRHQTARRRADDAERAGEETLECGTLG